MKTSWQRLVALACVCACISFRNVQEPIKGDGQIKRTLQKLPEINQLQIDGEFRIYLQNTQTNEIQVETDSNLLPFIETKVVGTKLQIHNKDGLVLKPSKKMGIKIYISAQQFHQVQCSGQVILSGNTVINSNDLQIDLSGDSKAELEVITNTLHAVLSGNSELQLMGTSTFANYQAADKSKLDAEALHVHDVEVEVKGKAKVIVHAIEKLTVGVFEQASLEYAGISSVKEKPGGNGRLRRKYE
ncbi:putative autotransporter adhesin-like protein [Chitinophaga skermanii]|uniref:Putative autotransporter adhesin-like protein n=1 Tax=Chitinophaga skermanii TaxID=331697 RepID=A0A327QF04_9BACT|nr:DUF2807 domain-containing protein [Chitinophaga skermanii]RAJ02458.1 putative autotransporter adhesin-like protein [Chitinophaga skermanii]